ncbi:unnamed protein product [Kluyveromyces dobzhanskii CBS 2104]|uniref:WGS project CCBQ000000000 data, contig 00017 n=1 Tax=Kluyveromyces dobzhanskii CBS 2104 TaxID=1427455 RepID=A0A0A8L8N9_9SACH|nr:unnamed protein product [Kluyveromyces dobzhanskii CBS 2104]
MNVDWDSVKKDLLDFVVTSVDEYLSYDPDSTFYAFALTIDFDHLEVNLALNTNEKHELILKQYYADDEHMNLQKKFDIKYNPGDWEGATFATKYLTDSQTFDEFARKASAEEEHLENQSFRETAWYVLKEFVKTESYKAIPKIQPFVAYVIDHDEEVEDALNLAREAGTSEL